jgi:hypothetical protein
MTTAKNIKVYGRHNATAQSMLVDAVNLAGTGKIPPSVTFAEYTDAECVKNTSEPVECRRWEMSADYMAKIRDAKWNEINKCYLEACISIETRLRIPSLHIESEAGIIGFNNIEANPRPMAEIERRVQDLKRWIDRRAARLNKTLFPGQSLDSVVLAGAITSLVAKSEILMQILYKPVEDKNHLLAIMYGWFARREREVLLYQDSKDVDKKRPYDETTLHSISEMVWIFNDCNPFENLKQTNIASFKVKNEPDSYLF